MQGSNPEEPETVPTEYSVVSRRTRIFKLVEEKFNSISFVICIGIQ